MKFTRNPKAAPSHGDTRIVRKFAWWPTKVEVFTVWLEWYESHEEYYASCASWVYSVGWRERERRLI